MMMRSLTGGSSVGLSSARRGSPAGLAGSRGAVVVIGPSTVRSLYVVCRFALKMKAEPRRPRKVGRPKSAAPRPLEHLRLEAGQATLHSGVCPSSSPLWLECILATSASRFICVHRHSSTAGARYASQTLRRRNQAGNEQNGQGCVRRIVPAGRCLDMGRTHDTGPRARGVHVLSIPSRRGHPRR